MSYEYKPSARELRLKREFTPEYFELWSERAGVMEFEGGMSRDKAEQEAEQDTRRSFEQNQKQSQFGQST